MDEETGAQRGAGVWRGSHGDLEGLLGCASSQMGAVSVWGAPAVWAAGSYLQVAEPMLGRVPESADQQMSWSGTCVHGPSEWACVHAPTGAQFLHL